MPSKKTLFSISKNKGFTLIELLMVLAILAVLASIAVKTVQEERRKANDTQAFTLMRNILTVMATETPTNPDYFYASPGGVLQWDDNPEIQVGKNVYVYIDKDTDGEDEGKWQVFGAHIGGKLGFYFWVPGEGCTVDEDDQITDTSGNPTPSDRIVPSFAATKNYVYTDFRNEAIP